MNENEMVIDFQSVLAIVIKGARLEKNIPKEILAKICNKDLSLWEDIERGEGTISLQDILCVSNFFAIDISYLFSIVNYYCNILWCFGWYMLPYDKKLESNLLSQICYDYYKDINSCMEEMRNKHIPFCIDINNSKIFFDENCSILFCTTNNCNHIFRYIFYRSNQINSQRV